MIKKSIPYFIVVFLFLFFLFGYLQKDKLNKLVSEKMEKEISADTKLQAADWVKSNFNFAENGENYEFTLLEFGSTGCVVCKQMEAVLEEIRKSKSNKIKVVFLHSLNPENQDLIHYFGISAIPMQVLLNKRGEVFFKNYGFISADAIYAKTAEYRNSVEN